MLSIQQLSSEGQLFYSKSMKYFASHKRCSKEYSCFLSSELVANSKNKNITFSVLLKDYYFSAFMAAKENKISEAELIKYYLFGYLFAVSELNLNPLRFLWELVSFVVSYLSLHEDYGYKELLEIIRIFVSFLGQASRYLDNRYGKYNITIKDFFAAAEKGLTIGLGATMMNSSQKMELLEFDPTGDFIKGRYYFYYKDGCWP